MVVRVARKGIRSGEDRRTLFGFFLWLAILVASVWAVSWFSLPQTMRRAMAAVGIGYGLFTLAVLFLWFLIRIRKRRFIVSVGERVVIVAPHQDDCVALGGGYAIQTLARGGKVWVLFVTDGYRHDKFTRKKEALDAWAVIGMGPKSIVFLPHDTFLDFQTIESIRQGVKEIAKFLRSVRPQTVIVPLYEGGNFQHDVVNFMASRAVAGTGMDAVVWEAPEYNFYFSWKTTPEKITAGLARLIPFVRRTYPPEPILDDPLFHLDMTPDEIGLKKEMLSKFTTQNPDRLMERFGFEDRFQALHNYDYTKPPFEYRGSLAEKIDNLKSRRWIGPIVSRAVKWTRTIHPDPDIRMSKLPPIL